MTAASPVFGARLREARRSAGLTQVQAAASLRISRPTLIALEQGRRAAAATELVEMARIYGRQVHELVREGTPVEALAARFRLQPGVEDPTREAVDVVQRLADDVVELESLVGAPATRNWPAEYDVHGLPLDVAARQVADSERRRVGLGTAPVLALRELLEDDYSIRVFAVPLPSSIAGFFAIAEPAGACVAINARHPHERQRWTLAHELGHFLMHRHEPEVSHLKPVGSRDERLAEAFAAQFLMPSEEVTRRFQSARQMRRGQFTVIDLLQLASQLQVSPQAMTLRLEELRLVSAGWWDHLSSQGLRVQEARNELGISAPAGDQRVLPRRTQYLAVEAFLTGQLSEGRLSRLLHTDRVTARNVVGSLVVSTDVAAEGETRSWTLLPHRPQDS